MCFPIDKNTMYLFTHGIAPSVISPNRRYFQGGKSVPLPLKVVKYYGSGDMVQIATEILGLSKMNWNSFGLYSKLPCTIESSNEIARIGWLLSQFEGSLYDYRFFMWPLILYNAWQKYTVLQQQTHLIFFLSILEYLQPDILPRNMVQNICMPDGIFRYSSLKVNLYEEIFIVYF